MPELLDHLAETRQLEGALVTIDAMGTLVEIADKIHEHKADYAALKGSQPTLEHGVADYFRGPEERVTKTTIEKGHGHIETHVYTASSVVNWIDPDRSYPGQPRFRGIKTIVKIPNRTELADRCTFDTRQYISSAPLNIERLADAARGHWGVESFHWLLVVRRFTLNLVRASKTKGSVKLRRRTAGWRSDSLLEILLQLR
ncbi:ISAs1 family transposase [Mesorhizobium hawassense]|uniref:ISAs1 family transposase n=1 Tax=Mesorhizobium hawassense TaxID=1209954 RepID=A0A330HVP8_9HYPH|nr:ISAs1 family transposase [Mesorhizobium hawassense]